MRLHPSHHSWRVQVVGVDVVLACPLQDRHRQAAQPGVVPVGCAAALADQVAVGVVVVARGRARDRLRALIW